MGFVLVGLICCGVEFMLGWIIVGLNLRGVALLLCLMCVWFDFCWVELWMGFDVCGVELCCG